MSRLVRMDQTGHTTLAEWTADDPHAVEAAVAAFRAQLDDGYFALISHGEGQRRTGTRAPRRRAACDPAPPDRRGLGTEPAARRRAGHCQRVAPRAGGRLLAPARERATLRRAGRLWTLVDGRAHGAVRGRGAGARIGRPDHAARSRRSASSTRGPSRSCTRPAARALSSPAGRRGRARTRRARAARRPRRPRRA